MSKLIDNNFLTMDNIINVTLENFQQAILEGSQQKLVMVDFWADWCEPCKSVMPILDKLAAEYADSLILAKVNCDEQQQIAMQFGVRSLPTVLLVKDGQPIDGFAGAQPEAEIRGLLEKHLPKPEDDLVQQAASLLAAGDAQQAFTLAKQAHDLNPERADISLLLADAYIELGRLKEAKALLDGIRMVDQDNHYQALLSKLQLAEEAADSPEIKALQAELDNNPDDLALRLKLAVQLHQAGRSEEALEQVFKVLYTDVNFDDGKKTALDIINALPDGDALASKFRRKFYSLLY